MFLFICVYEAGNIDHLRWLPTNNSTPHVSESFNKVIQESFLFLCKIIRYLALSINCFNNNIS